MGLPLLLCWVRATRKELATRFPHLFVKLSRFGLQNNADHGSTPCCSAKNVPRGQKVSSGASAASSLDFGVEPFQFHASMFDAKLPVDAALSGIRLGRPDGDFRLEFEQRASATVAHTLAG